MWQACTAWGILRGQSNFVPGQMGEEQMGQLDEEAGAGV